MRTPKVAAILTAAGLAALSCFDTAGVDTDIFAVAVTPESASIVQGDTVRLVGTALDRDGVAFLGPTVIWISREPSIALVATDGLVLGGLPGVTAVIATLGTESDSALITVTAAPFPVLSPMSLTFNGVAGGNDPAEQTVTIANAGGGSLSNVTLGPVVYGAGQPTGWLTASVSADQSTLTARVSLGSLPVGTYDATVRVGLGGNAATGSTLTVTLVVS